MRKNISYQELRQLLETPTPINVSVAKNYTIEELRDALLSEKYRELWLNLGKDRNVHTPEIEE